MYINLLHLHNTLRWVILIVAAIVLIRSYSGWAGKRKWAKTDTRMGLAFSSVFYLQFLIGFALYAFYSPLLKIAFADFGAAMKNAELRFIAVEHTTMMVVALVLIHLGQVKSKKANTDVKKHRAVAIFYSIATILMLVAIPWGRL